MKIQFTPKVAHRMVTRAKKNFNKNNHPTKDWKRINTNLPVLVCVSRSIPNAYGYAAFVTNEYRKFYSIDPTEPMVKIKGQKGWLVIELHAGFIAAATPGRVFKYLAHEYAHCLDYVIRNELPRNSHDEHWQLINNYVGGNVSPIDVKVNEVTDDHIEKIIYNFGGNRKVAPSYWY